MEKNIEINTAGNGSFSIEQQDYWFLRPEENFPSDPHGIFIFGGGVKVYY